MIFSSLQRLNGCYKHYFLGHVVLCVDYGPEVSGLSGTSLQHGGPLSETHASEKENQDIMSL